MTELGNDDIARLLAPFDLRVRKTHALARGTINSNYRVTTDGGPIFLRVNEGKSEADVRYEAELLWWLGARRYPTPQPLRTSGGDPFVRFGSRLVTVFPFLVGEALTGDHHFVQAGFAILLQ